MKKIALIFYLLAVMLTGLSAQNYATLHEDCNFRGRTANLAPGTYRLYQMQIGNDKLSSFQLPAGYRLTIYENDYFGGRSRSYTGTVSCLDSAWDNLASSVVVENTGFQQTNPNEYVVLYSDCYQRGFSRSFRPGIYQGADLGELKNAISSFSIFGNLRIRAYTTSDNASGFFTNFEKSETCLSRNFNDRISSLVVEYNPNAATGTGTTSGNGAGPAGNYAVFYTECNYRGNALSLLPGRYTGEELGMFRKNINSVQLASGLRIKVYESDNLTGISSGFLSGEECLSFNWRNRIGSVLVEAQSGFGNSGSQGNAVLISDVVIYSDAGYKGQAVTLLPGTYPNMRALNNFPDKALSSIQIPPGYRVILYDQENLRGKTYILTSSRSSFSLSNWNDRTSSIAVYRE